MRYYGNWFSGGCYKMEVLNMKKTLKFEISIDTDRLIKIKHWKSGIKAFIYFNIITRHTIYYIDHGFSVYSICKFVGYSGDKMNYQLN